jgi:hypothetical protein
MKHQPNVDSQPNRAAEHRARIVAANGKTLFVASQAYANEEDLIIDRELARRALNDEISNDPVYSAQVDALMARTDVKAAHTLSGGAVDAGKSDAGPERNPLADALTSRAGIISPSLSRLLGADTIKDEQG